MPLGKLGKSDVAPLPFDSPCIAKAQHSILHCCQWGPEPELEPAAAGE